VYYLSDLIIPGPGGTMAAVIRFGPDDL
jgi:hypothetical protein